MKDRNDPKVGPADSLDDAVHEGGRASIDIAGRSTRGWVSVATAAAFLDLSPDRLRKTLERHARKVDGSIESSVDGVIARKFGRLWRVRFSTSWTNPGRR